MIIEVISNYKIKCNDSTIEDKIKYILLNFISYYIVEKKSNVIINNIEYNLKKNDVLQFYYLDLPNNIITCDKINKFIKKFENKYNNSFVFGKGPTFINREKKINELYFGINQTVNALEYSDFFCANDLHNIYKINDFSKIKYILIPEYLHIEGKFNKNGHWYKVYEYLKDKFYGDIVIFNLRTNKYNNNQYITIPKCKTTSNVAVNFICIYLHKIIKKINTYGIGINCKQNYNNIFVGNGEYKDNRIKTIRDEIINICCQYNLNLNMN